MRTIVLPLALVWIVSLTLVAESQPRTLAHVDPKAPCFRWPAVDMDGDGVFDRVDHCVNTPKGCVVDAYGCETDADGDGVCDGIDRCPDTPHGVKVDATGCPGGSRTSALAPPPAPKVVPVPPPPPEPATPPRSPVERQLVETGRIRIENIYFETGSPRLLPESESTLEEVGQTLAKYPYLRIEVQGHTDTRGRAPYNMRLSQERAESVREFLLTHFKLTPSNYVAKGYGETRPETEERNDEELYRNRRVVLEVLNPEALPKSVKVDRKE